MRVGFYRFTTCAFGVRSNLLYLSHRDSIDFVHPVYEMYNLMYSNDILLYLDVLRGTFGKNHWTC